jgi:hypothetical protein
MVGLIFGGFVIKCIQELFGECEFGHVGLWGLAGEGQFPEMVEGCQVEERWGCEMESGSE